MGISIKLEALNLKSFLSELQGVRKVESGVVVEGPAAAYAEVWEWGNVRQTKKGPRTVLGINPDGESVWLSSQAPTGYIWTNTDRYLELVKSYLSEMDLNGVSKRDTENALVEATSKAAEAMSLVVQDSAPVDTGQLKSSIKGVDDGDPILGLDGSLDSRFKDIE